MAKRVALVIPPFGQDFLKGVAQYVQSHHDWDCQIVSHWQDEPRNFEAEFEGARLDGMIVQLFRDDFRQLLEKANVPVVNVSSFRSDWPFPTVLEDNHAIGRLAARYFAERGYRHFAFVGETGPAYGRWRLKGFRSELQQRGFELAAERTSEHHITREDGQRFVAWLASLPKPLALLACNDSVARQVSRILLAYNVMVPEQVAVLGIDNDVATCELLTVPISSIDRNAEQIGFEAAKLLEELMEGRSVPAGPVLVPPQGVVERASTQQLAVDDSEVAAALQYIRENVHDQGLTVEGIAAVAGISQRSLERRFSKLLGRTPRRELIRARLDRAARLLRETDLNLDSIAEACGFADSTYLCRSFKQARETTPIEYRKQHRMI